MATMTLCNAVFMLMLLAALSTCHGNAFGAWSGKQRQRKKKLAICRSWPWISICWLWDSNSGLSGIEPRALTTRPRRLGANLRRDATSRLLFLNQSVLADFDPRKKKRIRILRLVAFQARVIIVITRAWKATSLKSGSFSFPGVKICKHWLVEEQ